MQKPKIMATSSITSRQIERDKVETVTDFTFLGHKITSDSDCSHKIKTLAPQKKSYDNPRQHIKKHICHFSNRGLCHQSYGFSSMYGCATWTIMKAQCQRIDAFKLWCWRRLLRETSWRSNWSILKKINLEYLLEGLKLKLQYFGPLT